MPRKPRFTRAIGNLEFSLVPAEAGVLLQSVAIGAGRVDTQLACDVLVGDGQRIAGLPHEDSSPREFQHAEDGTAALSGQIDLEAMRSLEVCYPTAWLVKHKWLQVMVERVLAARVEVDDTY